MAAAALTGMKPVRIVSNMVGPPSDIVEYLFQAISCLGRRDAAPAAIQALTWCHAGLRPSFSRHPVSRRMAKASQRSKCRGRLRGAVDFLERGEDTLNFTSSDGPARSQSGRCPPGQICFRDSVRCFVRNRLVAGLRRGRSILRVIEMATSESPMELEARPDLLPDCLVPSKGFRRNRSPRWAGTGKQTGRDHSQNNRWGARIMARSSGKWREAGKMSRESVGPMRVEAGMPTKAEWSREMQRPRGHRAGGRRRPGK